jgi:hypothetical protein
MLTLADRLRALPASPFGLRESAVSVVTRTWSSGRIGYPDSTATSYTDTTPLPIVHTGGFNPKIREMSTREISASGGLYELGDLIVGPITPRYPDAPAAQVGGYTEAQVAPRVAADAPGVEVIYLVTGPEAGRYRRVTVTVDHALHYTLVLRRSNKT